MQTLSSISDNKSEYSQVVISAGVDWITATGKTERSWEKVYTTCAGWIDINVSAGQKCYHVSRNGYRLTVCNGMQYGRRADGWMVQLSGDLAARMWRVVAAYAQNITRIDLQATVWYNGYAGNEVETLFRNVLDEDPTNGARGKVFIKNVLKGDTLYIGSRTSAQYGRIYDKHKQSKGAEEFDKTVRFEVEFKKPLALAICTWLLDDDPTLAGLTDKVLGWFERRGIVVPEMYTSTDSVTQLPRREVNPQKQLDWLRKQVRPTYQQLRLAGYGIDADEALGVNEDQINITTIKP